MGGSNFGPNFSATSNLDTVTHIAPIKQSVIDSTRPLRNVFPKSTYTINTKVDENLVMVDDGDEESN